MPMINHFSAIFPPSPVFTDKHLPSLEGKVYIVTGAASGVGLELAKILYLAGGTVHVACRSSARCEEAIEAVIGQTQGAKAKGEGPKSKGRLEKMIIDLSDLATVKPAVQAFLKKEGRLDVLVHNAAVMEPLPNSKDKQVSIL
jgi:retinol dehydrogenase 12